MPQRRTLQQLKEQGDGAKYAGRGKVNRRIRGAVAQQVKLVTPGIKTRISFYRIIMQGRK